jgi:hypothetical protein
VGLSPRLRNLGVADGEALNRVTAVRAASDELESLMEDARGRGALDDRIVRFVDAPLAGPAELGDKELAFVAAERDLHRRLANVEPDLLNELAAVRFVRVDDVDSVGVAGLDNNERTVARDEQALRLIESDREDERLR